MASMVVCVVLAACSGSSGGTSTVRTLTETLVDHTRPTPASGAVPGHPGRTLLTHVWFPALASRVPLIVFAHGFGTGPDLDGYVPLLERWASAGYVVAAPAFPLTRSDAPGGPDAADYVNQPGDVSFIITSLVAASASGHGPLAGRIDPTEIGAAGHSLGGVTTLGLVTNSCCLDRRVRAAVVMSGDPLTFPGGHNDNAEAPPLLLVHGNADTVVPYVSSLTAFNQAIAPKALLTILGGEHSAPVDSTGPAFATVVKVTTDFFDEYLGHQTGLAGRLATDARSKFTTLALAAPGGPAVTLPVPTTVAAALHASVSPSTGLHDGEVLSVTWSGFRPGVTVNVLQCDKNPPTSPGDCGLQSGKLLQPDLNGTGSLSLTVHRTIPGVGACGTGPGRCVVVVNEGGSEAASASVIVPISFSA